MAKRMDKQLGVLLLCLVWLSACDNSPTVVSNAVADTAHTLNDYQQARQLFWRQLYSTSGETLYCGEKFVSDSRSELNVEHVFPMSWAINGLDCGVRQQCRDSSAYFNKIEADLHNLYPARREVNYARGSFRFGLIDGESRRFGQSCDFEVSKRKRVVEPRIAVRGDIARAMFYMAYQYADLRIFKRQQKLLLRWHQDDPPSDAERLRNNKIAQLQGNRNPFIDQPQLLTRLVKEKHFGH